MSTRFNFTDMRHGTSLLKRGFAKMQEGGVIMDVVTPEEAHIAEDAGAVSVMALERVPADIRAQGGVARMSHPEMIKEIIETTSIPVMAKARIGHDDEAKVLQSLGVDMVDESEVLTPADLEDTFGLTEGNIFHGELTIQQLFSLRPAVKWADYTTPIKNYYQCGSGTHPGGGITGSPGEMAAKKILGIY